MWTYNNTDELYHTNMYKNISKKSNHELYHSDIYLGKDFSDGIKHWKYIKREKVNGKWRYYYKDSELEKSKRESDNAKELHNDIKNIRDYARNNLNAHQRDYTLLSTDRLAGELSRDALSRDFKYRTDKEKSDKRKAKYEKYLIKPMNKVSDAIYKGKQKIKNILSKINKKYKIVSTHHERTITRNRSKKI